MSTGARRTRVSVVIPCYNAAQTIGEAVSSVQAQTFEDWEAILVDDGSTDQTRDAMARLAADDSRIRVATTGRNSGVPAAPRNLGFDLAGGEYVAFLDADDIWHPDKLAYQVAVMDARLADACFTEVIPFRHVAAYSAAVDRLLPPGEPTIRILTHRRLLFKNFIRSGSALMVRKSACPDLRFNADPRYKGVEDYLFALELHQRAVTESLQVCLPVVGYRLAGGSVSSSKGFMARQHLTLYRSYKVNGRPLGMRAWLYWISYAVLSLWQRAFGLSLLLPRAPRS